MNRIQITTSSFINEHEAPKRYSIFDNPENEKGTGLLKLPVPNFQVRNKCHPFNADAQSDHQPVNECSQTDSSSSNATFAPQLPGPENGLSAMNDEENEVQDGKDGIGCSSAITEGVHKRLQEQLALKQREVQEIQQKIAKNKKWGDPRRGPSQDRNSNKQNGSKLPMVRSCPESLNQMPMYDLKQRRRKNDSYTRLNEIASNLDPNSPCFYPSQFPMNNPVRQLVDGTRQGYENGQDDYHQNEDIFNPLYPPTLSFGGPNSISSACKNMMGRGIYMSKQFEHDDLACEEDKKKNQFGAVARPTFNQGRVGMKCANVGPGDLNNNNEFWPNLESENKLRITNAANDFGPSKFVDSDQSKKVNDTSTFGFSLPSENYRDFSHNSTNQRSNQPRQNMIGEDICKISHGVRIEPSKQRNGANAFTSGRFRVVRRRQDAIKTCKRNEQLVSGTLHCPSCKLDFQWPHVIHCLHSFCFSCIVRYFDKDSNQIKCPICSNVTELNNKRLQDLDLDFTICKKMLQGNLTNPFSCMSCSEGKRAFTFCQECAKFICFDCRHIHETNSAMSSHILCEVPKVKNELGKFVEVCPEHPDKKLDRYCEDCKKSACFQCTSFGERHSTHTLGDINKLYHSAVNKIELMNTSLDEVRNEVQKKIQPLTILKQHIETSIRLCKQEIHKYSNSLLAEAEKCRTKARLVIDKAHEDFEQDIEVAENNMARYMSEYAPLTDFFRRYLFASNPQDFMSLAPSVQKKILTMNEKHAEIQKHESIFDTNVSFKADYAGINEYLQNQYNRILITENLSEALPSESTEMGRRIEKDILATMERSSRQFSPRGSVDLDQKSSSGCSSPVHADPQSEIFNYNRTAINFIHQFGKYGRGEYEFVEPSGVLYLLDGSLAVCDTANHRIMVYDSQFKYVRTIGQPPNLPPLRERKDAESSRNDKHFSRTHSCLYFPYRIAQCPQTENIIVIERPPSRDIQVFTVLGQFITCFGSDILQHPRGVAVDEHGVIVTVEGRTMKLMLFSQEGELLHRFFLSVHLEFPNDIAARDGLIYISDNRGHCVHVFDYNAEHKHTIGNESVTYYPIGVSLTHLNQIVVTDNHNTFNISVFNACPDGQYAFGFKSKVRHANCYNVAVHPHRPELAVTSRENQVVIFNFDPLQEADDEKERQPEQPEIMFRKQLI